MESYAKRHSLHSFPTLNINVLNSVKIDTYLLTELIFVENEERKLLRIYGALAR
jgi:hypothetical protein